MPRAAFGLLLIVHGLAHALPGMQVTAGRMQPVLGDAGAGWAGWPMWLLSLVGFVAAGTMIWRGRVSSLLCYATTLGATIASAALLVCFFPVAWAVPGLFIDIAVLVALKEMATLPGQRRGVGGHPEHDRWATAA